MLSRTPGCPQGPTSFSKPQVLGVTLDAHLVPAYNAAQAAAPDRCQVLSQDADEPIESTADFKNKVADEAEFFLRK